MPYSQKDIEQFLQSLTPIEKLAYKIAKADLESSFDITRKTVPYCLFIFRMVT